MIAILDYGAGNLASVVKATRYLGHECIVTADPAEILRSDSLIIPGVGNFKATAPLANGPLGAAVKSTVGSKPLLGICLGLQWMFANSAEAPELPGLAAFGGTCTPFSEQVKSPHVGWDRIEIDARSRLLHGVAPGAYVYFTHSYRAPLCADTVARCTYGEPFTAAVERGNLFGVQFHPEKSGGVGLEILENFCVL